MYIHCSYCLPHEIIIIIVSLSLTSPLCSSMSAVALLQWLKACVTLSGNEDILYFQHINQSVSLPKPLLWSPNVHCNNSLSLTIHLTPNSIQIRILVWRFDLYHDYWLYCDLQFNITIICYCDFPPRWHVFFMLKQF